MGQNLRSEKLSFGSVHTYLLVGCGENIDSGEKIFEKVSNYAGMYVLYCIPPKSQKVNGILRTVLQKMAYKKRAAP